MEGGEHTGAAGWNDVAELKGRTRHQRVWDFDSTPEVRH